VCLSSRGVSATQLPSRCVEGTSCFMLNLSCVVRRSSAYKNPSLFSATLPRGAQDIKPFFFWQQVPMSVDEYFYVELTFWERKLQYPHDTLPIIQDVSLFAAWLSHGIPFWREITPTTLGTHACNEITRSDPDRANIKTRRGFCPLSFEEITKHFALVSTQWPVPSMRTVCRSHSHVRNLQDVFIKMTK